MLCKTSKVKNVKISIFLFFKLLKRAQSLQDPKENIRVNKLLNAVCCVDTSLNLCHFTVLKSGLGHLVLLHEVFSLGTAYQAVF